MVTGYRVRREGEDKGKDDDAYESGDGDGNDGVGDGRDGVAGASLLVLYGAAAGVCAVDGDGGADGHGDGNGKTRSRGEKEKQEDDDEAHGPLRPSILALLVLVHDTIMSSERVVPKK